MRVLNTVLLLLFVIAASSAKAGDSHAVPVSPDVVSNVSQLARDPVWLSLLHYEKKRSGEQYSSIVSDTFFISERGSASAEAELRATIEVFLKEPANPEYHCRFPARLKWLRSKVTGFASIQPVNCGDFEEWVGDSDVQGVSIVFAAGHMKSPASYFGHNFLKFNSAASNNFLLDHTVNYGADVPPEHGALPYLYNGIFGGYRATYETQQFIRHMALYGEQDQRDLWEYELDLTGDEVELLLLHAWELRNHQLSYYFFRENCAYHIARLLGLATTELFVPKYMPWTMPYNVMSRLAEVRRDGKPFVKNIIYHPSRRSRFRRGFVSLNSKQREQVRAVIDSDYPNVPLRIDKQAGKSTVEVIDTLLDYYELIRRDGDDVDAEEARRGLLLERLSYPPSPAGRATKDDLSPPHLASKPGYAGFGYFTSNDGEQSVELSLRPAYFDYLSDNIGRSNIGNFTLLDTKLRFQDKKIRLHSLNIIDISNLIPSGTGIAGDTATSWRFSAGFGQTNNACVKCLRPIVDWQIGHTWSLSGDLSLFALTGFRAQGSVLKDSPLVFKTTLGLTGELSDNMRVFATIGRHEDIGSNGLDRNPVNVQLRFHEHRDWDIRLHYLRDVSEEVKIAFGRYW